MQISHSPDPAPNPAPDPAPNPALAKKSDKCSTYGKFQVKVHLWSCYVVRVKTIS